MSVPQIPPVFTGKAGALVQGFLVKAVTPLLALRAVAYELEHARSGARLLHLHTEDDENLFSISFPTPPPDDTGMPHILEHTVLSGSRKFPVRDPFFEMLKMSMATFLNAMTGWDCTYYPVASNVKKDLFNLAEVYFDAVFHPLLTETIFQREGHHLAPARPDDPLGALTVSGIVYNEMKGAFSSPESRLRRTADRGLFPDTLYGRESGGDPDRIPDLTSANLRRFHRTYYHPGNAYLFLYGNIPTTEYLAFLQDKLDAFDRQDIRPVLTRQPRWRAPQSAEDSYPIGRGEPDAGKTYLAVNWLVGDGTDVEDVLLLTLLSQILLGHEAAPLRKAIVDSKLGQDLIHSGFDSVGLETVFRVGLKGSEPDRLDAFVKLVTETLSRLADQPMEHEAVDAAFQQIAYRYLEITRMFPLSMMERALATWIYGDSPLTFLRVGDHLTACRRRYEADPALFNRLIRERMLDNPHRLTVLLRPDRERQGKTDAAFSERMRRVRVRFSDEEMKRIAAEAEELETLSGTPNPPEALAKLPQLQIRDLPRKPKHIPTAVERLDGQVEILRNDIFANGVNYLFLDLSLAGLPDDLWPYMPRYMDAIRKLGAAGMSYEQIARRAAACTGGIGCGVYLDTHASDPARSRWGLRLTLKALDDRIEPALDLLGDLLFAVDPRDRNRLRDALVQAQAQYRTEMVYDGSQTAMLHAARGLTPEGRLREMVNGLPQLALTDRLTAGFGNLGDDLMAKIEAIRDFLLVRDRLTVSFTGSDASCERVRAALSRWVGRMGAGPVGDAASRFEPYGSPPREGLAGPIQVAHCARVIPAYHVSHPDEPLLTLGAHIVGMDYLLNEIRFKGNAYGAWCQYNSLGSVLSLGSYRDPHIARTLTVFDGVRRYVQEAAWTQTEIDRAIIATAKLDERPLRPGEATGLALHRHITGITRELRERRHAAILAATPKEVKRALSELLDANLERGAVCVVSSREKIEEANRQMPGRPLTIQDILK